MDLSQPEQVILDENLLAKGFNSNFFHLTDPWVRRCSVVCVVCTDRTELRSFNLQEDPSPHPLSTR